jgi:predicted lipoprotein with Yx(FWY)xxD motif
MMTCRRPILTGTAAFCGGCRRARTAVISAAAAVICLAACGSSSSSSGAGATSVSSPAAATVSAAKLPGYSSVLTTPSGHAVYLLSTDPSGASRCNDSCTAQWPPLLEKGALRAGPGIKASLLSVFKRKDGKEQVMYNHHALYTHTGQGAASGAGLASDGGVWYLVSPSGTAVKSTSSGGY